MKWEEIPITLIDINIDISSKMLIVNVEIFMKFFIMLILKRVNVDFFISVYVYS